MLRTNIKMQGSYPGFEFEKGKVKVELSSGSGGGGNLEGVENNEANQLSRGEIFLTFFASNFMPPVVNGKYFLLFFAAHFMPVVKGKNCLLSFFAIQKTKISYQSKDLCRLSD